MSWLEANFVSEMSSIVGRIKFLLGKFESALVDFDHVANSTIEGLASIVLDQAMVKYVLAKYPKVMQDINTAIEINPNKNDVKRFQACLEDIFCMDSLKLL